MRPQPGVCYRIPMLRPAALAGVLLLFGPLACQTVDFGPDGSGTEASEEGMPTPEPQYDCDPALADACPAGQKCTALEFNGVQNLFQCVDDDPNLMPYQSCVPEPDSGRDRCPAGHLCVSNDEDQVMGLCMPLCGEDGSCGSSSCIAAPFTDVPVCATSCSPLAQDCPATLECLAAGSAFGCRFPGIFDVGTQGEVCDGVTLEGCTEGYGCIQGNLVNGCATSHCCTTFCDLDTSDPNCPSPHSCQPWANGTPAPGLESLGICVVPA